MPSCGTSSNIVSTQNNINITQSGAGSRLACNITSGNYQAGMTAGDAIYYSVGDAEYRKSKADDQVTAEVFGVVESYNSSDSSLTVIISGSINIDSNLLALTSELGGSGGRDIFFLSGSTAGKLQDIAPTTIGHVVKPVYQVSPHGSYSGIVNNYIGYVVGNDTSASVVGDYDGGAASFALFMNGSSVPDFYKPCDGETLVTVSDNPKYLEKMDLTVPFIMKVQPLDVNGNALVPNQSFIGYSIAADIRPNNFVTAQYKFPTVTLHSVDSTYYYFKVDPLTYSIESGKSRPTSKRNTSEHILSSSYSSMPPLGFNYTWMFGNGNGYAGGNFFVNSAYTLHALFTPKITLNNEIFSYGNRRMQSFMGEYKNSQVQNAGPISVYVKTKGEDKTTVFVPDELSIENITSDSIILNGSNLATRLSLIEADIATIKTRLRIS
jgi:hypothetical protein